VSSDGPSSAAAFPPPGFVDRREAAGLLGVVTLTLKRYVDEGKVPRGRQFRAPDGRRRLMYSIEELARAKRAMEEAAARYALPDGYLDLDGACAMFGVSLQTWGKWTRQGRVPRGEWGRSRTNKPMRIYRVELLERLLGEMRSPQRPHRDHHTRAFHVPEGFVRLADAPRLFGVEYATFHRWELEGRITCGERVSRNAPKIYPIAGLERIVRACGKYSPPYPDPQRPGVWLVPLAGRDMQRREAIVDEADVPLLAGKRCHWSDRGQQGKPGQVVLWDGSEQLRLRQVIMGVRGIKFRVGHRNGDPLDCTRANLVVRTKQQVLRGNGKNKGYGGEPCSSRFKGVCFDKWTGRWRAGVVVDGKTIRLGRFRDEIAAAQAYDEAAREFFGEHARLNFPDGVDAWLEAEAVGAEAEAQGTQRAEAA
jgi:predicted site-specific integrase-resolvase